MSYYVLGPLPAKEDRNSVIQDCIIRLEETGLLLWKSYIMGKFYVATPQHSFLNSRNGDLRYVIERLPSRKCDQCFFVCFVFLLFLWAAPVAYGGS